MSNPDPNPRVSPIHWSTNRPLDFLRSHVSALVSSVPDYLTSRPIDHSTSLLPTARCKLPAASYSPAVGNCRAGGTWEANGIGHGEGLA